MKFASQMKELRYRLCRWILIRPAKRDTYLSSLAECPSFLPPAKPDCILERTVFPMRVITGSARGRKLKTPENYDIRPTTDNVKEALFNIIQFDIEGRRVLDLFAGTGQLGIEALSRGAKSCVFIDESREAVKIVKENLKACGLSAPVLQENALNYLRRGERFDLIFVDPPYDAGLYEPVLEKINSVDILSDGGIILCESRRETVLPEMRRPYYKKKEYRYGRVKLSLYAKESSP